MAQSGVSAAGGGEARRRQILNQIKEKHEPNSSYFQEFLIEYELLSEYRLLQKNGPHNGVYVIPSHKSALIWFGVIFVRSGPYAEGVFKFRIHIPHDYPANSSPPTLVFDPPIYHPMVEAKSGAVNFQTVFPAWTHPKNRIWHIIPHMRRLFLKVEDNPDLVVNSEAANIHREKLSAFKIKAKECVEHSQSIVYEAPKTDDINEIHFVELSDDEFVLSRNKMLRTKAKQSFHSKSGCSWMTDDAPSRPFAELRN